MLAEFGAPSSKGEPKRDLYLFRASGGRKAPLAKVTLYALSYRRVVANGRDVFRKAIRTNRKRDIHTGRGSLALIALEAGSIQVSHVEAHDPLELLFRHTGGRLLGGAAGVDGGVRRDGARTAGFGQVCVHRHEGRAAGFECGKGMRRCRPMKARRGLRRFGDGFVGAGGRGRYRY